MKFIIVDDGTLDTVVECAKCGEEFRFSTDALIESITDEGFASPEAVHERATLWAHEAHEGECPAEP